MIRIATTENSARVHHYQSVIDDPEFEFTDELTPPYDDAKLANVDALLVSCDQHLNSRLAINACKKLGKPTFQVLDGVVDWRTTFESPKFNLEQGGVPLFQPMLADCAFVMGQLQKNQLNWLGNKSVIATGLPRFDSIQLHNCRTNEKQFESSEPGHVLVATANTPWSTPEQKTILVDEFKKLNQLFQNDFPALDVTFRVSKLLENALGVANDRETNAIQALEQCDALITSPSTFAVEAMMRGVPTLILDPFANPALTPSAWFARSAADVAHLLQSLMRPDQIRASYQDWITGNLVVADGKASNRICDVIKGVVKNENAQDVSSAVSHESHTANVDSVTSIQPPLFARISSKFSPDQLASLHATIPQMEMQLAKLQSEHQTLVQSHQKPNFRFVVGTMARYLKGIFRK